MQSSINSLLRGIFKIRLKTLDLEEKFIEYYILPNPQLDIFWFFYKFYLWLRTWLYHYSVSSHIPYQIFFLYIPNLQLYITAKFLYLIISLNLTLMYTCQAKLPRRHTKAFQLNCILNLLLLITNQLAYG